MRREIHAIEAYGNKGGDILKVDVLHDGDFNTDSLDLYIGHSCVSILHKIVPTEFITALVSKVILDHNGDLNAIIDEFDWDGEVKSQLKARVKEPVEYYTKVLSK